MILAEPGSDSSIKDDSSRSESDEEASGSDSESVRHPKTQYVHPKGKDKGGTLYVQSECMAYIG